MLEQRLSMSGNAVFELHNLRADLAAAVANVDHCYRRASGTNNEAQKHFALLEASLWECAVWDITERIEDYERSSSNGT